MCKSANEPGGPYRCTAHMKSALLESSSRYTKASKRASQTLAAYQEALAHKENTALLVEQMESADESQVAYLEDVNNLCVRAEKEYLIAQEELKRRSALLRTAQLNYDATIGGMQDISRASFELEEKIKLRERELFEGAEEEDARLDLEVMYSERERLRRRMEASTRNMGKRNQENHESYHSPISAEESKKSEDKGEELIEDKESALHEISQVNDLLDTEDINSAIDRIIEEEELHGIVRVHEGYTDPITGQSYSEQEMYIAGKKRRAEMRMLQRRMNADPNKEMLRQALRTALYRAMYFSRGTRRLVRLVGIGQFGTFIDKLEGRIAERNYEKGQKAEAFWRKRREEVAQEEEERFKGEIKQAGEKIAEIESELTSNDLSPERKRILSDRLASAQLDQFAAEAGLNGVEHSRAQWQAEEVERIRQEEAEREATADYIRRQQAGQTPTTPSSLSPQDDPFNDLDHLMTD